MKSSKTLTLIAVLLTACGGGGSDSTGNAPAGGVASPSPAGQAGNANSVPPTTVAPTVVPPPVESRPAPGPLPASAQGPAPANAPPQGLPTDTRESTNQPAPPLVPAIPDEPPAPTTPVPGAPGATVPPAGTAPTTPVPGPKTPPPIFRSTADAATRGAFAQAFAWPIIPIHVALQPDGRVMSFGTDMQGQQGGLLFYSVWEPILGERKNAVTTFDNTTKTDTFCAAAGLLNDGRLLITGGDYVINGTRNNSTSDVNMFDFRDSSLKHQGQMHYKRWYPTMVALADGRQFVAGGRIENVQADPAKDNSPYYASTPEVYADGAWKLLPGANSMDMFGLDYVHGNGDAWFYPRVFAAPNGHVFGLSYSGKMYDIDPSGDGVITELPGQARQSGYGLPTVMYRPGKILAARNEGAVQTIDITGATPVVADTAPLDGVRWWGSPTVMADGRVFVHGGSASDNKDIDSKVTPQIWDPATGQWSAGVPGTTPRLYHSTTLLMPDGTIFTGGGGAPGPFTNLNAEMYYPSYLFRKDGSGALADRPVIASAPASASLGTAMTVKMATAGAVSKVALARLGSNTHTIDTDQRYLEATFKQAGTDVSVQLPADRNIAIPGFYMVFVFDAAGVPAVAKIVQLG